MNTLHQAPQPVPAARPTADRESRNMTVAFQKGQHIVVHRLVQGNQNTPVPPGRYVIAQITRDLLGNPRYRIRSLPDEDIEAEVDLETLSGLTLEEGE